MFVLALTSYLNQLTSNNNVRLFYHPLQTKGKPNDINECDPSQRCSGTGFLINDVSILIFWTLNYLSQSSFCLSILFLCSCMKHFYINVIQVTYVCKIRTQYQIQSFSNTSQMENEDVLYKLNGFLPPTHIESKSVGFCI